MNGTASGKEHPGVNVTRAACFALCLLCVAGPVAAQTTGTWSYRVLERGMPIGSFELSVLREAAGWHIRSTGRTGGTIGVAIKQFEALYDRNWHARFLTVERIGPRASTLVHVVVGRATAHVDIVTAREARWHSHSISPDTVFLPDHAYAAFAAVAARLRAGGQRTEVPLLFAPDSERRAIVDAWESVTLTTRNGPVRTSRHTLSIVGPVPTLLHVWESGGNLLRVELPSQEIALIRADVTP
jgi:hypothetical protein